MATGKSTLLWGGLSPGDLVVVDTAPWIYLLEDNARFAPLFEGLFVAAEKGQLQLALSSITLAELLVGPIKHGRDALAKRYEKALTAFEIIPISAEIAVTAARLRAGTGLRLPDALQAATALERSAAALVTHDRDFSKLPGLRALMGETRR
jgi:predicted nucleic acid-binding protein